MRVAAIDQGTTSTRVLVADTDGAIEIACAITHQQIHPNPGWVEHDPEELLSNIRACLQAAGVVDAIGIDNQGETVVAWDAGERFGRALYFTRAPAPAGEGVLYHHVGLYAYTRQALEDFVALPPSPLEQREKLEQLRALEADMSIAVARVDEAPLSVDTPADLERARKILS